MKQGNAAEAEEPGVGPLAGGCGTDAATVLPPGNDGQDSVRTSKRLSALDSTFLYLERPPHGFHVAAILTVAGRLDYERLINDLHTRLDLAPRYMERVMPVPFELANPTWEAASGFDIRLHVHRRCLEPPGSDEQLAQLCAALYAEPLDRQKPLWEIYVIDGYTGGKGWAKSQRSADWALPRGCSVLFVKIHHCMIDGISGAELLAVLLDACPDAAPVPQRPNRRRHAGGAGPTLRLAEGIWDRIRRGLSAGLHAGVVLADPERAAAELRKTAEAARYAAHELFEGAPGTPLNGHAAGKGRQLGWITLAIDDLKAIKNTLGGSLNDVMLAIVAGALRRMLQCRGMNPDRLELRALVPVNVRGAHERLALGNRLSTMLAPLPVGVSDPTERLRRIHAATAHAKTRRDPAKMERLIELVELLPPRLQRLLCRVQERVAPINTICTNVPGPPTPLYLQGRRVETIAPFIPLIEHVGVVFAALSYAGRVTIGVTAEADQVPDVQVVVTALRASFEELRRASDAAPTVGTPLTRACVTREGHRQASHSRRMRILVPHDLSMRANCALEVAANLSSHSDAELLVLHAVAPRVAAHGCNDRSWPSGKRVRDASSRLRTLVRSALPRRSGHRIECRLRRGAPLWCIIDAAREVDLIVMTAAQWSDRPATAPIGMPEKVRRHAPVPVVAVEVPTQPTGALCCADDLWCDDCLGPASASCFAAHRVHHHVRRGAAAAQVASVG